MKVALGTNSLLVTIGKKSKYRPIFDILLKGDFVLINRNDILLEYFEIKSKNTNDVISKNIIDFLLRSINIIKNEIFFKCSLIAKDFDDNKFVNCALNAQADFLVTDNRHFNTLKKIKFPVIKTIKTSEFLKNNFL